MNQLVADPFDIFEQVDTFDKNSIEEKAASSSWQERIWLVLFDALVALALLLLLGNALPVEASSIELEQPASIEQILSTKQMPTGYTSVAHTSTEQHTSTEHTPTEQMTVLAVTLSPVGYEDSAYGLSYDGPIMYTISVTNRGLVAAKDITVSISLRNDPFLVQTPWDCDFDGCTLLIDELGAGKSQEIALTHGMIVPAIVVEREEDAYVNITAPEVAVTASNSLPATAPLLEDTLVCRCLSVYNPTPIMSTISMVYMPTVYVPSSAVHTALSTN